MTSQAITPYVLYRDVAGALAWLSQAFGFRETLRFTEDDGQVSHAEMEVGSSTVMLGQPGGGFRNPPNSAWPPCCFTSPSPTWMPNSSERCPRAQAY